MTTITIRLPEEAKRLYKARASLQGTTLTEYILSSMRKQEHVHQGSIDETMRDIKAGQYETFASVAEWKQSMQETARQARNAG